MRSSGSTQDPRPRGRSIPLFVRFLGEDDPRLCTGRRLVRRGLAQSLGSPQRRRTPPVTLDPYAPLPLSSADRRAALAGGLLAVDGSWNRLSVRGRFPGSARPGSDPGARRLPFLLATNPQHFGKWTQLNTVEALAAAVYLLGRPVQAAHLLEAFRGGPAFLEINRARLERYAEARSGAEVLEAERAIFTGDASPVRERTTARKAS